MALLHIMGYEDTLLGWRDAPMIVSVTVLDADLFSSRWPLAFGAAGGGVPTCGIARAASAGIACCSAILGPCTVACSVNLGLSGSEYTYTGANELDLQGSALSGWVPAVFQGKRQPSSGSHWPSKDLSQ